MKILIIGHETGDIYTETDSIDKAVLCVETAVVEEGDVDLTGYTIKRIFANHDMDTIRIFISKNQPLLQTQESRRAK